MQFSPRVCANPICSQRTSRRCWRSVTRRHWRSSDTAGCGAMFWIWLVPVCRRMVAWWTLTRIKLARSSDGSVSRMRNTTMLRPSASATQSPVQAFILPSVKTLPGVSTWSQRHQLQWSQPQIFTPTMRTLPSTCSCTRRRGFGRCAGLTETTISVRIARPLSGRDAADSFVHSSAQDQC